MSARARESASVRCRARAQRSKVLLGVVIINQTRCRVVIDQRAAPHLALHRSRAPPAHYDPCLSGVRRCACGARRSTGVLPTSASRGGTRSEVRLIHLRLSTQLVCQGLCLCARLCCCLRSSATPRPRGSAAPRRLHGGSAAPRGAARRCGGTARQIGCGLSRPATAVRGATRVVVVMVVVTTARACHAEEIPGCATSH